MRRGNLTAMLPFTLAFTLMACADAEKSSENSGNDGGTSTPDAGTKQPKQCGEVGAHGADTHITFSYTDCEHLTGSSWSGSLFSGRAVAVGGEASLFVTSPRVTIEAVQSSDESIAMFELQPWVEPDRRRIKATGVKAGTVELSLLSSGEVVETTTVEVREATTLEIIGAPTTRDLGVLGAANVSVCVVSKVEGLSLEGTGVVVLSSEGDVQAENDPSACQQLTPLETQGEGRTLHVGPEGGTFTATIGETSEAIHFIGVQQQDVDVLFDQLEVQVQKGKSSLLVVKLDAWNVPLVNRCAFTSSPAGVQAEVYDSAGTVGTTVYRINASDAAPGKYQLTCSLAEGTITKAIEVTVVE